MQRGAEIMTDMQKALEKMKPQKMAWIKIHRKNGKSLEYIANYVYEVSKIKVSAADIDAYLQSNTTENNKIKTQKISEETIPEEVLQTPKDFYMFVNRVEWYSKHKIHKLLSEIETSDILVKPLLKLLGWNFENPLEIQQNKFPKGHGVKNESQPDIVLGRERDNAIIIEVKASGIPIEKLEDNGYYEIVEKFSNQLTKYSNSKHNHKHIVITNGLQLFVWERSKNKEPKIAIIESEDFKNQREDLMNILSRQSVIG